MPSNITIPPELFLFKLTRYSFVGTWIRDKTFQVPNDIDLQLLIMKDIHGAEHYVSTRHLILIRPARLTDVVTDKDGIGIVLENWLKEREANKK